MNEQPSAEDVERDNAAVHRYLGSMAPHVRERLQAEWLGKLLTHSQQYAVLLRRLSGQGTWRVDEAEKECAKLAGPLSMYGYMNALARDIEAELGLAQEVERERCAIVCIDRVLDIEEAIGQATASEYQRGALGEAITLGAKLRALTSARGVAAD